MINRLILISKNTSAISKYSSDISRYSNAAYLKKKISRHVLGSCKNPAVKKAMKYSTFNRKSPLSTSILAVPKLIISTRGLLKESQGTQRAKQDTALTSCIWAIPYLVLLCKCYSLKLICPTSGE